MRNLLLNRSIRISEQHVQIHNQHSDAYFCEYFPPLNPLLRCYIPSFHSLLQETESSNMKTLIIISLCFHLFPRFFLFFHKNKFNTSAKPIYQYKLIMRFEKLPVRQLLMLLLLVQSGKLSNQRSTTTKVAWWTPTFRIRIMHLVRF